MSEMSENANHARFNQRSFPTKASDVENLGQRGLNKDNYSQLPQTRAIARGTRTVLGPLTNKQQEFLSHPVKQGIKDQNEQRTVIPAFPASLHYAGIFTSHVEPKVADSVVDLSCHEMDASLDYAENNCRQQSSISMDVHDSPILLDESNSEDSTVEDCDLEDEHDLKERVDQLLSMVEYRDEIYHYLRRAELTHRPKPNYMRRQSDITSNMRSILVDWLVEVADEYKLLRETLFLAVDYVDRFLSVMAVQRQKLQLVGAAAMFIASKYEEIYPPEVGEFVYITDDTYTKQQVLRMESLILKVLSFDVAVPTVHLFCERFLKEMKADAKLISLASYLTELSLIDGDTYLQYLPSITASAAICLARHTLGEDPWPHSLVDITQYKMADLNSCTCDLLATFVRAPTHPQQAIQEKYRQSKYHEVSLLQPPSCVPRPNY